MLGVWQSSLTVLHNRRGVQKAKSIQSVTHHSLPSCSWFRLPPATHSIPILFPFWAQAMGYNSSDGLWRFHDCHAAKPVVLLLKVKRWVNEEGYFQPHLHLCIRNSESDNSHEQSSSGHLSVRASSSTVPVILVWLNTERGVAISFCIIRVSEMWIQARLY